MSEQKEVDISLLVADAIANNKNLHKMCKKPTSLEVGDSEKKNWKINTT